MKELIKLIIYNGSPTFPGACLFLESPSFPGVVFVEDEEYPLPEVFEVG